MHRRPDQQQMIAQLMTIFGFLALSLATVGLYGVTAYGVERNPTQIDKYRRISLNACTGGYYS